MSLLREMLTTGDVSTVNSTTTPLAGAGVFTGTAESTLKYAVVVVSVYTDVASATDGLVIQQSKDGTNWDHDDKFTIPSATGKTFSFQPQAEYFRVVYTNGAGAQATFRLSTIKKKTYVKPSSHRIQDSISTEDDAELVKSVLTGEDPNGVFKNVTTTVDGNLAISNQSDGLAIAKGDVTGVTYLHKFGEAPDFDNTDLEVTVWDGADDAGTDEMQYNYSTTAAIDSISSSSGSDTVNIEVQGLDSSYNVVTQTIALTGQTRAALTTSLIRVFRMKNVGATDLVGTVYCYENTTLSAGVPVDTTKIRAQIQVGYNQTLMAVYTVPNGYTAYLREWYASIGGARKVSNYDVFLYARPFGQVFQLKHKSAIAETGSSQTQHKYVEPEKFSAKTDIEMRVLATAAATECNVTAGFDIVLVAD